MRILTKALIFLSALLALMSGITDFTESLYLIVAGVLYLIAHYYKHHKNYRQWRVSPRSKPFLSRFIPNIFRALIFVLIFSFIGYGVLLGSKTDFYITHLQSLTQSTAEIIDEIISFWMNIPYRLMRYEH